MTPSSFPSLPEFSPAPANAGGDPQLATLLASVAPPTEAAPGADARSAPTPEFSRWLAQPTTAAPAAETAEPGPGSAAPAAPGLVLGEPRLLPRMTVRSIEVSAGQPVDEVAAAAAPAEPAAAAPRPSAPPAPATRAELEAAAALMAPLGQALIALFADVEASADVAGPSGAAGAQLPDAAVASVAGNASQVRLTLQPGAGGAALQALTLPPSQVEAAPATALRAAAPAAGSGVVAGVPAGAGSPSATPADLAEWVRRGFATLALAPGVGAPGAAGLAPGDRSARAPESLGLANSAREAEPPATVTAELTLADGTTLRIEVGRLLAGSTDNGATARPLAFEARRPSVEANNAGFSPNVLAVASSGEGFTKKSFLKQDGEAVADGRPPVGIAVAETVGNMLFRSRSLPNDVPGPAAAVARGADSAFAPALAPESAPAAAMPLPSATVALAGRAVGTVVNIVETQAASRMQPVPSVQLHFQFGGEDLAVRVELRGGEVRTEFRTDSGPLRAALAEEWRAVATAPAAGLRLLEPAFGPAATRGSSFDGASTGHQPSSQHPPSQPQHADARAHQAAQRVARSFAAPPPAAATSPVVPSAGFPRAHSRHLSVVA